MGMSRNKRRQVAKLRRNRAVCDMANTMAVVSRKALVRENLSRPAKRETSHGLVTDYGLVCRPIAKRERKFTRGAANIGTSGGLPVA